MCRGNQQWSSLAANTLSGQSPFDLGQVGLSPGLSVVFAERYECFGSRKGSWVSKRRRIQRNSYRGVATILPSGSRVRRGIVPRPIDSRSMVATEVQGTLVSPGAAPVIALDEHDLTT